MAELDHELDHEGGAISRLLSQFRDKPVFSAFVAIIAARWQAVEDAAWQLYTERTIDTAIGDALDQLGKRAGYWPRNFVVGDGTETSDVVYRQRVRAKFIANRSRGLEADIGATFTALALPGITYRFEPGYPAAFTWRALEPITAAQARLAVRFLGWAKAAGVKALFAWQETTDALAFWTENETFASDGLPVYQAGTGVTAGIGDVTRTWPTHVAGDIGIMCVQTANEAVTLSTPAGFVEIGSSPQGVGTPGAAGACRLTVYWCRATSSSMASPVIQDPGDHAIASLFTVRGCVAAGDPIDVTAGTTGNGTSVSVPGATTTGVDRLVAVVTAHGIDIAAAQFSAWSNGDLGGLAEHSDAGATSNHGGGIAFATGTLAATGTYGATTATLGSSANWAGVSIALMPAVTGVPGTGLGFDDGDTPGAGGALTGLEEAF